MKKEGILEQWKESYLDFGKELLEAFRKVPREEFVMGTLKYRSYEDIALPIPMGQTISQPTTVMIMLKALDLKKTDKVLEIGTGSAYNAALIAQIAKEVYTIEIIPELIEFAKSNLEKTGIKNAYVVLGDGSIGYKKQAPYDKIIITAACPSIPKEIIEQLKEGGIVVAPVGERFEQVMIKAVKRNGKLEQEPIGRFMFVPLRGRRGFGIL